MARSAAKSRLSATGKPLDQPDRYVCRSQQQRLGIVGHLAPVEPRHHCAPPTGAQPNRSRYTLSASGRLLNLRQTIGETRFSQIPSPMHLPD
jgi:hypothetical protein